jgi:DNA-binding transcriptional regulator of glucitol operon
MITQYFWFFLAIAVAMGLQLYFTALQSKAFMGKVMALRAKGSVAIGLGGRRYIGRRAYVALAMDGEGRVVEALRLRGITQFARAKPAPRLVGVTIKRLAGDGPIPGIDAIDRAAARQAAQTLNTSGGWQPTGGVEKGKEGARPAPSLG